MAFAAGLMEFGRFGRASVTGAHASVTETRVRRLKFSGLAAIRRTLVLAPLPVAGKDGPLILEPEH